MIFIFTITIIGPIETGKPNPKKKHLYGFLHFILFDVFFHSNYKKEKIYITIIIKRRVGGKKRNITTGKQTITTQHKYLLTARNERYKNEKKENKRIWQKEKSKKLVPMKLNTISN